MILPYGVLPQIDSRRKWATIRSIRWRAVAPPDFEMPMDPKFPARVPIAYLPTPIERLERLSRHLGGPEIWIKRDDQTGLATGGIYASVALALVMIYQATHHINFAQGEMAMFSTYLAWTMIDAGMPYWVTFFAAVALAFVLGAAIERIIVWVVSMNSPPASAYWLPENDVRTVWIRPPTRDRASATSTS
mgnify:CR=1 FL=1